MSEPVQGGGWFGRLRAGLSRSSTALRDRITGIVARRRLDDEVLEELEEALIMADLGVETAGRLVAQLGRERFGKEVSDLEVREALAAMIARDLEPYARPLPVRSERKPQVVLVCGVNGTGKTTTIGKLAKQATDAGREVLLAACDTFRAAATEQLEVWADRSGVTMLTAETGADAAGLAYEGLQMGLEGGADLLLIDTAGRLQNKQHLMDELKKIVRVLKKLDPGAPHDTLLVLDGTTGQNAHSQVEVFTDMVDVSGLIVTKLDGTARAGVVVALARRFEIPIHAIGVGEGIDDLRPFDAQAFARALMGLETAA
jgi:fused signal recognition particle receptor